MTSLWSLCLYQVKNWSKHILMWYSTHISCGLIYLWVWLFIIVFYYWESQVAIYFRRLPWYIVLKAFEKNQVEHVDLRRWIFRNVCKHIAKRTLKFLTDRIDLYKNHIGYYYRIWLLLCNTLFSLLDFLWETTEDIVL